MKRLYLVPTIIALIAGGTQLIYYSSEVSRRGKIDFSPPSWGPNDDQVCVVILMICLSFFLLIKIFTNNGAFRYLAYSSLIVATINCMLLSGFTDFFTLIFSVHTPRNKLPLIFAITTFLSILCIFGIEVITHLKDKEKTHQKERDSISTLLES